MGTSATSTDGDRKRTWGLDELKAESDSHNAADRIGDATSNGR
jgi:hypothetical protein